MFLGKSTNTTYLQGLAIISTWISLESCRREAKPAPFKNFERKKIEKLLAKAGLIPRHQKVSMFVSIGIDVQANKPTTLSYTIGLTRLFEARNDCNKTVTSFVPNTTIQPQNTPINTGEKDVD